MTTTSGWAHIFLLQNSVSRTWGKPDIEIKHCYAWTTQLWKVGLEEDRREVVKLGKGHSKEIGREYENKVWWRDIKVWNTLTYIWLYYLFVDRYGCDKPWRRCLKDRVVMTGISVHLALERNCKKYKWVWLLFHLQLCMVTTPTE